MGPDQLSQIRQGLTLTDNKPAVEFNFSKHFHPDLTSVGAANLAEHLGGSTRVSSCITHKGKTRSQSCKTSLK
jgi:hypothetical protein